MPNCIVAAAIAGGINFRFDGKLLLFMVQLARQKFRQQNAAKFWHFKCKRQCASSTNPSPSSFPGATFVHPCTMLAEKLRQVFTWCTFDLLAASLMSIFFCDWFCNYVCIQGGRGWRERSTSWQSARVACEASKTSSCAYASAYRIAQWQPDSRAGTLNLPYISVCNVLVTFIIECRCCRTIEGRFAATLPPPLAASPTLRLMSDW